MLLKKVCPLHRSLMLLSPPPPPPVHCAWSQRKDEPPVHLTAAAHPPLLHVSLSLLSALFEAGPCHCRSTAEPCAAG